MLFNILGTSTNNACRCTLSSYTMQQHIILNILCVNSNELRAANRWNVVLSTKTYLKHALYICVNTNHFGIHYNNKVNLKLLSILDISSNYADLLNKLID